MSLTMLQSAPGMLASLGLPVTVYVRRDLKGTGSSQADVDQLTTTANAPIGATELQVQHTGRMAGRLPAGLVLTIGALELQLAAEVRVNTGQTATLPVAALEVAISLGSDVELARAVELLYTFRPRSAGRQFGPESGIVSAKVRGTLTGAIRPPMGALLNGEEIFKVEDILGGSGSWRVEAGAV